ncbi:hypothetical protein [Nocardioides sp.]|uniref:hypothetical protein n=1 Tax=Nocardioides sp. TaxID=35761 RepID=UPI0037849345
MVRTSRAAGAGLAVLALSTLSLVPAAAVAPAGPVAGAVYHGRVAGAPTTEGAVSFRVTKSGARVAAVRVGPYPLTLSCGSGGDPPHQTSQPVPIRHGAFTARIAYSGDDGVVGARATVTGVFLRNGRAKGTVSSHVVGRTDCDFSLPYTARVD